MHNNYQGGESLKPISSIGRKTFLQNSITFNYKNGKKITVSAIGRGPKRPTHIPLHDGIKKVSYKA